MLKDVPYSHDLWDPFVKYWAILWWPSLESSQQNAWSVSFAELVLDFEIFSGLRVLDVVHGGATTWARKSEIFGMMVRRLFRVSSVLRQDRSLFPLARVTSLKGLGMTQKLQGFAHRPRLLMGQHTERLVALNVTIHAYLDTPVPGMCSGAGRQNRLQHLVSYHGLSQKPLYEDNEKTSFDHLVRKLASSFNSRLPDVHLSARPYRRLRGKQCVPGRHDQPSVGVSHVTSKFVKRLDARHRLRGKQSVK